MEELDLVQLIKYYFKKLPVIVLIMVLFGFLGYLYVEYGQIPMYNGSTTIILVQDNEHMDDDYEFAQVDISINEKLVSTYSEIIKSRMILDDVIEKLKIKDITTDDLANLISVSSIEDTSIIKITASYPDSRMAVEIANKTAEVFKDKIADIYNLENVSIIDEAIEENNPYNISKAKTVVIFMAVGIVLSIGVMFLIFYFDTTIKDSKDIEEMIGLPILAEVPNAKFKKKKKRKKKFVLFKKKNFKKKDVFNDEVLNFENNSKKKIIKQVKEEIVTDIEEIKKELPKKKNNSKKGTTVKNNVSSSKKSGTSTKKAANKKTTKVKEKGE